MLFIRAATQLAGGAVSQGPQDAFYSVITELYAKC